MREINAHWSLRAEGYFLTECLAIEREWLNTRQFCAKGMLYI